MKQSASKEVSDYRGIVPQSQPIIKIELTMLPIWSIIMKHLLQGAQ